MKIKVLEVGILKSLNAVGVFVFSFAFTVLNGIESFGSFSYMLAFSNLFLMFGRFGCEYSVYNDFIQSHKLNGIDAFSKINNIAVYSMIKAVLGAFFILVFYLDSEFSVFFIFYICVFAVIHPYCFAFRAISSFKRSFLFEPGFFMLSMSFLLILANLISFPISDELLFTIALFIQILFFVMLSFRELSTGFEKGVLSAFSSYHVKNFGRFIHSLNEYICYWGIIVFFGFFLSNSALGVLSWGVRLFQTGTLIVGVKNAIDAPAIMTSDNKYELFLIGVKNNVNKSLAPFLVLVFITFLAMKTAYEGFNYVIFFSAMMFLLSAYLRYIFGLVFYIYNFYANTKNHLFTFLMVSMIVLVSPFLLSPFNFAKASFVFFLCWLLITIYSFIVIRLENENK